MTIARSIERNGINWSSGTAGTGIINVGHSDNLPANTLEITNVGDPFNGTEDSSTSNWDQKRTHELLNGQVIWDFGGNVMEWVDWEVTQSEKPYMLSDGSTVPADREFYQLDALVSSSDPFYIELIRPHFMALGSSSNLGVYHGGLVSPNTTGIRRGGSYFGRSGIYSLLAAYDDADISLSFRCVYEP
jgi:hypothetical protein